MTIYLIDANVLIRTHGDYYPIDRIKPFWDWLLGTPHGTQKPVEAMRRPIVNNRERGDLI